MTDHIVLQGVTARGYHGVLDTEKADGQDFVNHQSGSQFQFSH